MPRTVYIQCVYALNFNENKIIKLSIIVRKLFGQIESNIHIYVYHT